MKTLYLFLFVSLMITACSAPKQTTGNNILNHIFHDAKLENLVVKGSISSSFTHGMTANYNMKIAKIDSVAMTLKFALGGILVGKLYSTPDYFQFYNIIFFIFSY